MITVADIEFVRGEVSEIFPDAVRGSVSKSHWGKGRKVLHLMYGFSADTAFGYKLVARGNLLYFVAWDTNYGDEAEWAESEIKLCIDRIKTQFKGQKYNIDRPVRFGGVK